MVSAAVTFHESWLDEVSQDALAGLVAQVADIDGQIIEIGAWEGRSTIVLANAAHPRFVTSIDTWNGSPGEVSGRLAKKRDVFAQWSANVTAATQGNVTGHRMGWRDFPRRGPVALLFIDAEHTRIEVRDTIAAFLPLVQSGGIICGDDIGWPAVKAGVLDVLPLDGIGIHGSLWIWTKP